MEDVHGEEKADHRSVADKRRKKKERSQASPGGLDGTAHQNTVENTFFAECSKVYQVSLSVKNNTRHTKTLA